MSNASKIAGAAFVTGALLGAPVGIVPAAAQQPPWSTDQAPPPKAAPKAAPKAPPKAAPAAPKEDAAAASRGGDPALRQRIEQLEEQLADMQVTMGTLESLGKVGGAQASASQPARAGGSGGAMDNTRIDSLETQIRALADQVEQLSAQMRRRSDLGPQGNPGTAPRTDTAQAPPADLGGFGNVTVTPGVPSNDPIGRMIDPPLAGRASANAANLPSPNLPTAAQTAGSPKELYETAYGYLLQQDYGGAEVTFEEFIRRYPTDRQAPDAQYWYGETLYVQRRYKPAAQAFLKVIDTYPQSAKAPNGILKLAMTLEQLGQKDCGLFTDLDTRHPNAPADVKTKARALKQRVGC